MSGVVTPTFQQMVADHVERQMREEMALLEQIAAWTWAHNASVPLTAVHIVVQEGYGLGLWRE